MTERSGPPPVAKKIPYVQTLHGHTRNDEYAWLKDERWQQVMHDPSVLEGDIRRYLENENAYTETQMSDTEHLQRTLFSEMRGRIKENDSSVPAPDGAYAYYVRYQEAGQHPKYCRTPLSAPKAEELLLDGDTEAKNTDYYKIGAFAHSHDHAVGAFAEDRNGSEIFRIRFRDLATGHDLADELDNTSADMEWAEDGRTLFYTVLDENHRPSKVMRHLVGTDFSEDVLIYEEADPGFFIGLSKTESRSHIIIDAHDHETSEVRLIPAASPMDDMVLVSKREQGTEYSVSEHQGRLVILTNADGAEDFKIVTASVDAGRRSTWQDLVPHQPGNLIIGHEVFERYLVRVERVDALPRIVIRDWATNEEHIIAFDEDAYSLGLEGGFEFATQQLRFSYSSPTTPRQIFDYDMSTRERTLRKQDEIPSGHDPDDYVTKRIHAPTQDGERVPVTILHHADTPLDGTAPVLLYGYGSYGASMPAFFGAPRLSLVDRGFIYAVAHIRGGMERGYRWYADGKREKKKNTFNDFIAAAEGLISEGLAKAGRIAIHGGSAGGMLVGACTNMRPDLWRCVVADVPFVDVLNTMCDTSLPLTPIEWPEWGNPIEDETAYEYIQSYSPYDQVSAKDYPAILATAGLTDPRVTYWEPAKWVAKLRDMKTDDNVLLLKTNMAAGHAGAAGRFDRLYEVAFNYAFVLKNFDIKE